MEKQKTIEVEVHKGHPTCGISAPSVVIDIKRPIQLYDTLDEADRAYYKEAWALGQALEGSLPGGTFDRLVVYLLKRKVSDCILPHMMPSAEEMPRQLFYERAEQMARDLGFTSWRAESVADEITWQAEEAGLCYREPMEVADGKAD